MVCVSSNISLQLSPFKIFHIKQLRRAMNSFCEIARKNPEQVWLDLCQPGQLQKEAISFCKKFLKVYSTKRKRKRVSLGPKEYSIVPMVRRAATLQTVWQDLVLEFNHMQTVLARKRE